MASPCNTHPTSVYPYHQHKITFTLKRDFLNRAYALRKFLLSYNLFIRMQIKLRKYACSICDSLETLHKLCVSTIFFLLGNQAKLWYFMQRILNVCLKLAIKTLVPSARSFKSSCCINFENISLLGIASQKMVHQNIVSRSIVQLKLME